MFETLINSFNQHLELCAGHSEQLIPHLVEASGMLVSSLLNEKKIITCAGGSSAFLANHFASCMQNRFQHERPGLPAISLCGDGAGLSAIAHDAGLAEIFGKPIQALGQAGDILLILSDNERNTSLVQAVQAAHDREMQVIAINSVAGNDISAMLQADDLELQIQASSKARILELELVLIHCLAELIEQQLFGA